MSSEQLQGLIRELLLRSPMTIDELAGETGEPRYRIRAELGAMRRNHHVAIHETTWHLTGGALLWTLTDTGIQEAVA